MAQSDRLNISKKKDQGVDIGQMISAPLVAASQANTDMLKHQAYFLMDFCFDKIPGKDAAGNDAYHYEPYMIEMTLTRSVEIMVDGQPTFEAQTLAFKVPVMTLIPINSLAVDNVNVEFDMEIISQTTRTIEGAGLGGENKIEKAELRGKIGSGTNTKSDRQNRNTSRLKVTVEAKPLPLPLGVSTLLNLYSKSILPVPKKNEDTDDKKS